MWRGLQMMEPDDDQEPIEIVVPGQYYFRNGNHYLRYEEILAENSEPTVNYIKISPHRHGSAQEGSCEHAYGI